MTITYKEQAIFCESNIKRVNQIISSKREPKRLAEIPPSFIVLDLTWNCNYECLQCVEEEAVKRGRCEMPNMPTILIEDIFDYAYKYNVRGLMTMGGEPFLNKEGIEKALEKSIQYQIPLKTVTNGSYLGEHIENIVQAYKTSGSILRVSINANKKNYKKQTRSNTNLEEILNVIKQITSKRTPISVSTVVFPENSKEDGAIPNINSLDEIIRYCEQAGVQTHILLPAREPVLKRRYGLSDDEKEKIREIKENNYELNLEMESFSGEERFPNQNLDFNPCPSGFIFTSIGPNGKIYKCTDNRGRESMVLGKIEKPGDFEKFWHSEQRVRRQIQTQCRNSGCSRYKVNAILDSACDAFARYEVDITNYLEQPKKQEKIFV